MNPRKPIHAVARCIKGLSKGAPNLPSFPRCVVRVNMMKNITAKASETAMKAGVVAVGAAKRSGAFAGRTVRSAVNEVNLRVWTVRIETHHMWEIR